MVAASAQTISASESRPVRSSVELTWRHSEFSFFRLQYSHDDPTRTATDNALLLQYDERSCHIRGRVVREGDQDRVVGHGVSDLTVQADGRATPGVGTDLDLAEAEAELQLRTST